MFSTTPTVSLGQKKGPWDRSPPPWWGEYLVEEKAICNANTYLGENNSTDTSDLRGTPKHKHAPQSLRETYSVL